MPKEKWQHERLRLHKNHNWRARPGYKVFVADRGAVRFDIPDAWTIEVDADSIKFHDRPPPDDDCLLQVSVMHLNPQIDWTGVPLADFLAQVLEEDSRGLTQQAEIKTIKRSGFDAAWTEAHFVDTTQGDRPARARACLALGSNIQTFITMDFWDDDYQRFSPVWDEVLRSLRLGEYIADPRLGPV